MWSSRSLSTCNASRRRGRHPGGARAAVPIEDGAPGDRAEREQDRLGQSIEQRVQLLGDWDGVGPLEAQARPEPGQGRADESGTHQRAPATQRAARDHRLAPAGEGRPFVSRLDPVTVDMHHRLDHRRQGGPPAPQLGGHQGRRRARAEADPQDRHVLEVVAGGQIADALAVATAMESSAGRGPADRTGEPRLRQQPDERPRAARNRRDVASQARCEYTTDRSDRADTGPTGRQPRRPRVRTFPFRIRLRATERAAQPNPKRAGSGHQSEIETALEVRTEWRATAPSVVKTAAGGNVAGRTTLRACQGKTRSMRP